MSLSRMSISRLSLRSFLPRARSTALVLALTSLAGFSVPYTPVAIAAATLPGTTELSPTPPGQTQAVAPNIVLTFDDSGSMQANRVNDYPPYTTNNSGGLISGLPDWSGGPWRCANVIDSDHTATADATMRALPMNGVFYNNTVVYTPPTLPNGTSMKNADGTLASVWVDGLVVNRPLSPVGASGATYGNNPDLDQPSSGSTTNVNGVLTTTKTSSTDNRWKCGTGAAAGGGGGDMWNGTSPMDGNSHTLSDGTVVKYPNGGPYYYRLKTTVTVNLDKYGQPATSADLTTLYTAGNWEAVPVPTAQYQNFANWYAYYRTRNQMARSAMSRVFGANSSTTSTGGYGNTLRMAWQNLNTGTYKLPSTSIISELIDTASCTATASQSASPSGIQQSGTVKVPPACYRSAFYNWLYQVPASGGTPTRSAFARAGAFYQRGSGNTGTTGNLEDPYWEPPASGTGAGNELSCRQNFHMLVTDGLWNGSGDGPSRSSLTLPTTISTLPDGVSFPSTTAAGVTSIYAPVDDAGDKGYASLSDIAFNYWATDLRPDLYAVGSSKFVPPYMPDGKTGIVTSTTLSGSSVTAANTNDEIYFNPANDPASWPHMSEYLVGLGVSGQLKFSTDTDCTTGTGDSSDACLLRKGLANSSGAVGWPTPNGSGSGIAANVDDTWHAALAGRGQFFSAGNPQQLVDQLSNILTSITARAATPTVGAINASVLAAGAISFNTGYDSTNWTGLLQAIAVNLDGTLSLLVWDAGVILTNGTQTPPANRQILTATANLTTGVTTGAAFEPTTTLDATEALALMTPVSTDPVNDTQTTRINYLRGVRTEEASGVMRTRTSLLGPIIDSQPAYISYPTGGYINTFPTTINGQTVSAPEMTIAGAQTYDQFLTANLNRAPTLYVGANDGMLHAFNAPVPTCLATDANGNCTGYNPGTNAGKEIFAYVPRAVYGGLGNLTSASSFKFGPTVNGSPIVRDVFFSENGSKEWHSILVSGLRGGGRGVFALDVTNPSGVSEASASSTVLWEFDASAPAGTGTAGGSYNPADMGYTYGQPNVGRLANGEWVVLIPAGYFPDCSQPDRPVNCAVAGGTPPVGYSSLFILDAQTGAVVTELKTPTTIAGVTSYGLTSPVLGDYNNDQVDDVAFAGDLAGNLWRFDLSSPDPTKWFVTLAYLPVTQGAQPITVMPRLFPDPSTNRFTVVFGTGKYLGASDNVSTNQKTQSVYGIRDTVDSSGNPVTINHSELQAQTLSQAVDTNPTDPDYGATLRSITANPLPLNAGGWYFDLNVVTGERVVVTPGALFNTNTVLISTLILGSADPCNPTVQGAIMAIDATTGGPGSGVSSLGGGGYIGALVNNVRTNGALPSASTIGGGQVVLPGLTLTGKANNAGAPLSFDSPIWRRRSWSVLNN